MSSLPLVEEPSVPPAANTVTLSTTPFAHNSRSIDLSLHLKPTPPSCPHPSRGKDGSAHGKREAPGPIVTSDEEEPPTPPESPREAALSPSSHDHDYESVGSPGGSSTASGPIYVRTSGFTQHAHSVTVSRPKIKKKKSNTQLIHVAETPSKTVESTTPTLQARAHRQKKDPVPMRMRALPQSFWQQPNVAHNVSPAQNYPVLPPLFLNKDGEEVAATEELRPISPVNTDTTSTASEKDKTIKLEKPNKVNRERKMTVANTDLLFKLFETVEKDPKSKGHSSSVNGANSGSIHSSTTQIRRGRPRKMVPVSSKSLVSGEDPYMVDCVTEKLFPQLNIEHSKAMLNNGTTVLQVVTLKEGDRSVCLPSLSVEQNYSQMLSELVMHI